jgi:hypothetical protein
MSKAKAARDAIAGLSDVARRWLEALSDSAVLANSPEFMTKLKNLGEQFPEAFRQYDPPSLVRALNSAAKGDIDLALIDPQDFRMLAHRGLDRYLPPEGNLDIFAMQVTRDIIRKVDEYADMYEHGLQFNAIPHLYGTKQIDDNIVKITGHEGRHRMRAQEKLGANKALVKIIPEDISVSWKIQPRTSEVDPSTFLQPEPYLGDLEGFASDRFVAGEWQLGVPSKITPGPYKSIGDVLKFLSLGGFSFGALKDLTDE